MRLLILLLVIALIVVLAWAAYSAITAGRLRRARWTTNVRSLDDGGVVVELRCQGQKALPVARLDPASEDFSDRLAEARAVAREREASLNAVRRA